MRKNILLLCFWQVFILIIVAASFHILFLVLFYTSPSSRHIYGDCHLRLIGNSFPKSQPIRSQILTQPWWFDFSICTWISLLLHFGRSLFVSVIMCIDTNFRFHVFLNSPRDVNGIFKFLFPLCFCPLVPC